MPQTYTPIATTTVSGTSTADVTFSSITGTYTDLVLVSNTVRSVGQVMAFQLNGDTAANYSNTLIYGTGSAAASSRGSANSNGIVDYTANTTNPSTAIQHFQNYSNTTTYKTSLSRLSAASDFVGCYVNLWRSTAAITSIKYYLTSGYFVAGSTFTLYGIKAI